MKKQTRRLTLFLLITVVLAQMSGMALASNGYQINGVTVRFDDSGYYPSSPSDCWNYANAVYKKIWGVNFSNSFDEETNYLRNLSDSNITLTAEHLKKYVSEAAVGAVIRICNSDYLHSWDSWGHSQVIVQKDSNGFTVFEGGLDAYPHCREKYYTWNEYINTGFLGQYSYIKYIKWPGAGTAPSVTITEDTSTIYLDAAGGSVSPDFFYINFGENWTLPTPERQGYDFDGWYSEPEGQGSKYSNDERYWGRKEKKTVYANWISTTSTIFLDPTGGTVSPASFNINFGDNWTLPTPQREGYVFDGWYSEPEGQGSKYTNNERYWGRNEKKTVYANWKKSLVSAVEVNLPKQTVYFQDQFADVPANQWYTKNVAEAFELGLMKGNSSTIFNPYGDVTIAEAVTMASRIHNIYTNGSENIRKANSGEVWYKPYMDYAYDNGIIRKVIYNSDVTRKANRAQFAEIFANALPVEALSAINSVTDNAIPDVKTTESYASYVYKLYRAGILGGSDANGTFHPTTYITRAEAAAIVSRMGVSDNRITLTLE